MSTDKGNHVRIVTPKLATDGTQVFVDGVEIAEVLGVEFIHRAGSLPIVAIGFHPESVEVEAEAVVERVE